MAIEVTEVVSDARRMAVFTKRMVAAEAAGTLKMVQVSNDRWLIQMRSGAHYLVHFFTFESKLVTPGIVNKRIARRKRFYRRLVQGHIVLCYGALSPTLLHGGGKSLPEWTALVGHWGSSKQKLLSRKSNDEMKEVLRLAGIGVSARRRSAAPPGPAPTPKPAPDLPSNVGVSRGLRRGERVDCYRLIKQLGKGFSAEVWLASVHAQIQGVQLPIGQEVAIKFYKLPLLHGIESLRIQREFAIASDLYHVNLARVFDLVLSPSRPFHTFMVMEYIAGVSLKDYAMRKGQVIPAKTIVEIGIQLFSALEELHSLGAIHRDVKPANIMLEGEDPISIKLVDLGIVSVSNDLALTAQSAFLGSKHSAPLEQLTGLTVDHRADIYGAGATLFHCYMGKPMYAAVGPEGAIVQRMLQGPEKAVMRGTPAHFEGILVEFINRCIAVDREDRFASAAHCLQELERLRSQYN